MQKPLACKNSAKAKRDTCQDVAEELESRVMDEIKIISDQKLDGCPLSLNDNDHHWQDKCGIFTTELAFFIESKYDSPGKREKKERKMKQQVLNTTQDIKFP